MNFYNPTVIGPSCLFWRVEMAKKYVLSIYEYPRAPLVALPAYADKSGWARLVSAVFPIVAQSKILFPIVKSVAIDVVNLFVFWRIHNLPVHSRMPIFRAAGCVKSVYGFIPHRAPQPPRKIFKIFSIHDCHLPLSKGDQFVGLVERLSNLCVFWPARHI